MRRRRTIRSWREPSILGRHGQIRTADLSLRRRPLYPTELRAHCPSYCSCARRFPSARCRSGNAFRRIGSFSPRRKYCAIAAFRSSPRAVTPSTRPPDVSSPSAPQPGPRLKHGGASSLGGVDSLECAFRFESARVTAGRQHHADAGLAPPLNPRTREPPSAAASSSGTKSDAMRCISGCVSGSPRRTLNSRTLGPSAVIISPA